MKIFLDTEFHEGFHKPLFGKRRHFIDLISIALVCEDGREYYAISKDFNLKKVWKDEWLRENVLSPIHDDLRKRENMFAKTYFWNLFEPFTYKSMKNLIKWHGKSNKRIAEEIKVFVANRGDNKTHIDVLENEYLRDSPEFYGYYADYDWVLFCSLFGRMINLPAGFPQYCRDLKQVQDEKSALTGKDYSLKEDSRYPIQEGEHDALSDAKWNQQLYDFLQSV